MATPASVVFEALSRIQEAAGPQVIVPDGMAGFLPSATFQGPKPGYHFSTGAQGTG
jgi:hypothetical protein